MMMFDFIRRMLMQARPLPSPEKTPVRIPSVGEVWIIPGYDDPWGGSLCVRSRIREVLDGWVRYDILPSGGIFMDQRMKLNQFIKIYLPPK